MIARVGCHAIGMALLLSGCAVGPEYERPAQELPAEWPQGVIDTMDQSTDIADWWRRYEDPVLDRLVAEALSNNLDIGLAAARVAEARAALGMRRADQFPTVDAYSEMQREDPGLTGSGPESEFIIAGALNYEVDLWGRLSRGAESARASLLSSAFARDAVRLTVISDVVSGYFDFRAALDQVRITERTIASREESLEVEEARFSSGATTELALRQAEAELETSRAELPTLRNDAERRRRALAILVGDSQSAISGLRNLGDVGLPEFPDSVTELPAVLPSELIERRPDIRAAEAHLIAANADIGAARAEWFPRVDLLAVAGTGATAAGDLFTGPASLWELLGTVTAPILDFGRRQAEVDGAEARYQRAEIQYRATILDAIREVADAWTLLETADERLDARSREVSARRQVVELAESRYTGGFAPYLEVLDARRALFEAELSRSSAARDRLVAAATLYKALGGGWDMDPEQRLLSGEG